MKVLKADELGFQGDQGRIFVNDHLSADTKLLINKARQAAKEKNY